MSIRQMRKEYTRAGLLESAADPDPIRQFSRWFAQAVKTCAGEPNAMSLATVSPAGRPAVRIVLLKGFDARGFSFYTNYHSAKARDLAAHRYVAAVLFWPELERQVRIAGSVTRMTRQESAAYFHSRPRGSQLGAWASDQSTVIPNRSFLENQLDRLESQYAGRPVPLPPFWGGYRIKPLEIEFWQGRPNRLHDRLRYRRGPRNWAIERLSP